MEILQFFKYVVLLKMETRFIKKHFERIFKIFKETSLTVTRVTFSPQYENVIISTWIIWAACSCVPYVMSCPLISSTRSSGFRRPSDAARDPVI